MEVFDTLGKDSNSLVVLYGINSNTCGYCASSSYSSLSYGMHAKELRVEDYQDLIDLGWRRSGNWLYKPNNRKTCCPQYTIRLDVERFKPSKSQKRVKKRMERFLSVGNLQCLENETTMNASEKREKNFNSSEGEYPSDRNSKSSENYTPEQSASSGTERIGNDSIQKNLEEENTQKRYYSSLIVKAIEELVTEGSLSREILSYCQPLESFVQIRKVSGDQEKRFGSYVSAIALVIEGRSKQKNKKKKRHPTDLNEQQMSSIEGSSMSPTFSASQIAELIVNRIQSTNESSPPVHISGSGYINFCPTSPEHSMDSIRNQNQENSNLYKEKNTVADVTSGKTHCRSNPTEDLRERFDSHRETPNAKRAHDLEVSMIPATFLEEEYDLYCKYQIIIHGDEPECLTKKRYTNFLVASPFSKRARDNEEDRVNSIPMETSQCEYGLFHQQYRLDKKLIAVGVVDVLPKCLSSVYFFYDPDYLPLNMGVYSALQEIEWVRKALESRPLLRYYYMGYYIHSCQKMRYKGRYKPSDLLCDENFEWVPLSQCLPKLERQKYCRFVDKTPISLSLPQKETLLDDLNLFYEGKIFYFKSLPEFVKDQLRPTFIAFLDVVKPELAKRLIYSLK